MAQKPKDYYTVEYARELAGKIAAASNTFNADEFLAHVAPTLETLEFGQRQQLIAEALRATLGGTYTEQLEVCEAILGPELEGSLGMFTEGWWLWPVGRFVELYGRDDYDASLRFCRQLTKRFTGEYAMRTLLDDSPERTITTMIYWSRDDNKRIRRLASECLRTRLPWAKKSFAALDNPDQYSQVLRNLKDDPDKTIQKSEANNLALPILGESKETLASMPEPRAVGVLRRLPSRLVLPARATKWRRGGRRETRLDAFSAAGVYVGLCY